MQVFLGQPVDFGFPSAPAWLCVNSGNFCYRRRAQYDNHLAISPLNVSTLILYASLSRFPGASYLLKLYILSMYSMCVRCSVISVTRSKHTDPNLMWRAWAC